MVGVLLLTLPALSFALPEELDPAVGDHGVIRFAEVDSVAVRLRGTSDGKKVAAVSTSTASGDAAYMRAGVWRLAADGTADRTFGSDDGFVPASAFCANPCRITDLVVHEGGVVLLTHADGASMPEIVRLASDGRLDERFGSSGVADLPANAMPAHITEAANGSLLVVGRTTSYVSSGIAWKLLSSGRVDTTFGVVAIGADPDAASVIAGDDLGRVLVAAPTGVMRFLPNGTLDATFGVNGVSDALVDPRQRYGTFRVTAQGRILILLTRTIEGGNSTPDTRAHVAALRDDGHPDLSFGDASRARVLTDRPGEDVVATSMTLDAAGRIVVAGYAGDYSYIPFNVTMSRGVVARFGASGAPDLGFAPGGSTTFWVGSKTELFDVAPSLDGRIWLAGTAHEPLTWDGGKYPHYHPRAALMVLKGGASPSPRPLHQSRAIEYFNAELGHYFATAHPGEASGLDRGAAWTRTGATFDVWAAGEGKPPVCRFWSGQRFAPKSSHFYTPYAHECEFLKAQGLWTYEGDVFGLGLPTGGACGPGERVLYRAYNNGMTGAPNHRYTTDAVELDRMIARGWAMEGDAVTRVFACLPGP